jgi:hypothetical protein
LKVGNLKRFVFRLAIFLLPLWGGSFLIARKLDYYFKINHTHKQLWSLAQHNQSVDYAVLGSSRAFHNIDIPTLEKRVGGKAINLGYDGQSIIDIYLTLHIFLSHQNQARTVVMQLDGWDLSYTHKFLDYLYLPYTADDRVSATLAAFRPAKNNLLTRAIPIAKYAEYNEFYIPTILREARSNHSMYDENGGSELLFDDTYHVSSAARSEPQFSLDLRAEYYLEQIVELAKARGIKLVIFSAPVYRDPVSEKYMHDSRSYISSYCQTHEIPYLDLMDADFALSDFRDNNHLNAHGASRLTEMLGDRLLITDSLK